MWMGRKDTRKLYPWLPKFWESQFLKYSTACLIHGRIREQFPAGPAPAFPAGAAFRNAESILPPAGERGWQEITKAELEHYPGVKPLLPYQTFWDT